MRRLLLATLFVLVPGLIQAADVTGSINCAVLNSELHISDVGSNRVIVEFTAALTAGCVITPEASIDDVVWYAQQVKRDNVEEVDFTPTLGAANTGTAKTWIYTNPGFASFRIRVSTTGAAGTITVNLTSATTAGLGVATINQKHPNSFSCTMSSTAVVLTEITGCGVVSGRRYITGIQWASSTVSTVANFMLLRSGTGVNCAGATTDVWRDMAGIAFDSKQVTIPVQSPIALGPAQALCFIHAGAGTRFVNIQGFIAP